MLLLRFIGHEVPIVLSSPAKLPAVLSKKQKRNDCRETSALFKDKGLYLLWGLVDTLLVAEPESDHALLEEHSHHALLHTTHRSGGSYLHNLL